MEANDPDLYQEYLQGIQDKVTSISKDVTSIKQLLEAQPQAKDYSLQLENIAARVQGLGTQAAKPVAAPAAVVTPVLDTNALTQQLGNVVREAMQPTQSRQRLPQWVWYGMGVFLLVAALFVTCAADWKRVSRERNHYARSDWFWRASQQNNRPYASSLLELWHQDSVGFKQRVEQLEAANLRSAQADRSKQATAPRAQAAHKR